VQATPEIDTTTAEGVFVFPFSSRSPSSYRPSSWPTPARARPPLAPAGNASPAAGYDPGMSRTRCNCFAEPNRTITSIAKLLGVSRSTLYSALPGLVSAQRNDQAVALQDR